MTVVFSCVSDQILSLFKPQYWMTFRKLLIQETEYIQGLGCHAAVKRLKTYPIQRVSTP